MFSNIIRVELVCVIACWIDDAFQLAFLISAVIVLDLEVLVSITCYEETIFPVLDTLTTLYKKYKSSQI